MHEILARMSLDDRVLDLGCAGGSFSVGQYAGRVVRCDLVHSDLDAARGSAGGDFVRCDARALPFATDAFAAIISNHSLEHFEGLAEVLAEIRRVLRSQGHLYIAVPDSSTVTDRVYRWLAHGGGHVNAFDNLQGLVRLVELSTGLGLVASRVLFTSCSFLNRLNSPRPVPRRLYLLGGGAEVVLRVGIYAMRLADRWFGTRTSVYGWACCFGAEVDFDVRPWTNVCVRCGSGHASSVLVDNQRVRRSFLWPRTFDCPGCGASNYFTDDRLFASTT